MRKMILLALATTAIAAASIAASPKVLQAEAEPNKCWCVGGCDNYAYLNPCPNGFCSLFCTVNPE